LNYHINYNFVWKYFDKLSNGLLLSLEMAFVSIFIGIVIGLGLALAYAGSGRRLVRWPIAAYVELIRNVPLLLLVYMVYYGIPTVGGFAYDATTSFVMTLSVYAGAYLVEIFRAGLDAVPKGLVDAGKAIGLTPLQLLASVKLPTMFRIVLPSLSNTFVSLFKDTAVAWVIAVPELFFGANWIYTNTFRIVETWSILTPMYLVTCYVLIFSLQRLEKRYAIRRAT
jgi:polar amino acid transport system permease protein